MWINNEQLSKIPDIFGSKPPGAAKQTERVSVGLV